MEITNTAALKYSANEINEYLKKAQSSLSLVEVLNLIASALTTLIADVTLLKVDVEALKNPTIPEIPTPTPSDPEEPIIPTELVYNVGYLLKYSHSVPELSSLCLNATNDGLYGVSDRGSIYNVTFEGVTTILNDTITTDNEGITINPTTKDIYYCVERNQRIDKLSAPDYTEVTLGTVIEGINTEENKGFEGIAYYKDDIFFLGNQSNPCKLLQYSLSTGIVSQKEITCTNEIADLKWDGTNLWILDSTNGDLCKCDINGVCSVRYKMNFPEIDNADENFESFEIVGNTLYIASENTNLFVVNLDSYSEVTGEE